MVSKYFVALFFCNLWAIVSVLAIARMHTMCSFKVKTFVGWWLSSPSFRYSSPTLIMLHVASISSTFPSESSHFTSDFCLYFYHTPPDRLILPLFFASISFPFPSKSSHFTSEVDSISITFISESSHFTSDGDSRIA